MIVYLFLSIFVVSMCLAIFEGGQFRYIISTIITYSVLANLFIYAICLFASLFPLKYSNKGQNKSKLIVSTFLSWITVYICMVFLDYSIISSYDTLLESATSFISFFVPAIISPIIIYFVHDKIVKRAPNPSKKEIKNHIEKLEGDYVEGKISREEYLRRKEEMKK